MSFKENRKLAFAVLTVVVLFSILVQGPVAMLNRRGDTEVLFMEGEMHPLMLRCSEQAALLANMSEYYLNAAAIGDYGEAAAKKTEGANELPIRLEQLSAQLANAPDPNACLTTLSEMTAAVEKVYTALELLNLPDGEFRDMKLCYYDYKGALDIISRDGDDAKSYTANAREFNSQISRFPAKLLCNVLDVEPLAVYGG